MNTYLLPVQYPKEDQAAGFVVVDEDNQPLAIIDLEVVLTALKEMGVGIYSPETQGILEKDDIRAIQRQFNTLVPDWSERESIQRKLRAIFTERT